MNKKPETGLFVRQNENNQIYIEVRGTLGKAELELHTEYGGFNIKVKPPYTNDKFTLKSGNIMKEEVPSKSNFAVFRTITGSSIDEYDLFEMDGQLFIEENALRFIDESYGKRIEITIEDKDVSFVLDNMDKVVAINVKTNR